jgi:hypothetical protein
VEREELPRKVLGGYDRAAVDEALRERDERLEQLEREAQQLAKRVIDTEKRVRAEVEAERGGAAPDADESLGFLGRRLEAMQENARRRAGRLRLSAQEAVQVRDRVTELSSLRDELGTLVAELAGLAGIRVGGGVEAPPAPADGVYSGPVEVEVGPLRDFAQLTSFEDAASGIEAAEEVRVSDFSGGRATFSMSFAQPVNLVRELEQRSPFGFSVRAASGDGVVLDLEAA